MDDKKKHLSTVLSHQLTDQRENGYVLLCTVAAFVS